MNHLNYFNPYQRKKAHYEDQLTRAFMVVLKYVPLAQEAFLNAVRDKQSKEPFVPSITDRISILTNIGLRLEILKRNLDICCQYS